jgi:Fe-S oxidoreductase
MARYNGVIAAPRDVLSSVPGIELREMERSGRNTFCCGAGGGRMWMEETRGTRINAERTRQALATGAETVATSCPFCMVMMRDGLADAASSGGAAAPSGSRGPGANSTAGQEVTAQDIAELLAGSLAPIQPGRRALPVIQ